MMCAVFIGLFVQIVSQFFAHLMHLHFIRQSVIQLIATDCKWNSALISMKLTFGRLQCLAAIVGWMHRHLFEHIASPKIDRQPNFHRSIQDPSQFLDHLADLKMPFSPAEFSEKQLTLDGVFDAIISEILNQSPFLTKNAFKLIVRESRIPGRQTRWDQNKKMIKFESYWDVRERGRWERQYLIRIAIWVENVFSCFW